MNRYLAILATALMIAGCSSGPSPSTSASPTAGVTPAGVGGAIYVVHVLDDDEPFIDVRVDSVATDGAWQTVARFEDVAPAGWDDSEAVSDDAVSIGPSGLLLMHVELETVAAPERRTLLLDIRSPEAPPIEIADHVHPIWGPDGTVAWYDGPLSWIDLSAGDGTVHTINLPAGIDGVGPATADGSGWLAGRTNDVGDLLEVGVVRRDGQFVSGQEPAFTWTGTDRWLGAEGGSIGTAHSDGFPQSETVVNERRADLEPPCQCETWFMKVLPSDDPSFSDPHWDREGTGIWLPVGDPGRWWLSHVTEPLQDNPIADLPPAEWWRIVGITDDDRLVALRSDDDRNLALVDTETGMSAVVARSDGDRDWGAYFGGWIR